jgi:hypothetical protein
LHQINPFSAAFWVFEKLDGLENKDTLDKRKEMRATAKESLVSKQEPLCFGSADFQ